MFAKLFSCLRIAITPTEVPWLAAGLIFHSLFRHFQCFQKIFKTRFVWQKLAIEYFLFTFCICVNITEIPVIEFLQKKSGMFSVKFIEILTNLNLTVSKVEKGAFQN